MEESHLAVIICTLNVIYLILSPCNLSDIITVKTVKIDYYYDRHKIFIQYYASFLEYINYIYIFYNVYFIINEHARKAHV